MHRTRMRRWAIAVLALVAVWAWEHHGLVLLLGHLGLLLAFSGSLHRVIAFPTLPILEFHLSARQWGVAPWPRLLFAYNTNSLTCPVQFLNIQCRNSMTCYRNTWRLLLPSGYLNRKKNYFKTFAHCLLETVTVK